MASSRSCIAQSVYLLGSLLFVGLLAGTALAQDDLVRPDTVAWTAQPAVAVRQGDKLKLTFNGAVLPGWHVYSLKQQPEGPTPLLVALEPNDVAVSDGAVSESKPIIVHDPAFNLQTQYYEHAFAVTVPVRLKQKLTPGPLAIPVSVRFQTCNGRICQPPRTERLSATITLQG